MTTLVCGKEVELPDPGSLQAVFDYVVAHMKKQGTRAGVYCGGFPSEFSCRYRGDEGTSCAVGCLIPDDKYDAGSMEGQPCDESDRDLFSSAICGGTTHLSEEEANTLYGMLSELQDVHDNLVSDASRNDFGSGPIADQLAYIAAENDLRYPNQEAS